MLDQVKTLRASGVKWTYFVYEKDMNLGETGAERYRVNVSSNNSYVETKSPTWLYLEMRYLGGNYVLRVELSNAISALIRGQRPNSPSFHQVRIPWVSSLQAKRGHSQKLDHAGTLNSDFQPPEELWEINFYCLSHPVCSILLQQPKLKHYPHHPRPPVLVSLGYQNKIS